MEDTGYEFIPQQIIFNKSDRAQKHVAARLGRAYNAPVISAQDKTNLPEVFGLLDKLVGKFVDEGEPDTASELQLHTA